MQTLLDCNVSTGDVGVTCISELSAHFDYLITEIGKLLDQSEVINTNVNKELNPILTTLVKTIRIRVKLDLQSTSYRLAALASAVKQNNENVEEVDRLNRHVRRELVRGGIYSQLSTLHKNKLASLPLKMDAGSYTVAGNILHTTIESYSKYVDIMRWFNYVTNIIAFHGVSAADNFDASLIKQAAALRKLTRDIGAPSNLLEFTEGKFNHGPTDPAIERVQGTQFFRLVNQERIYDVGHSAAVLYSEYRRVYNIEKAVPKNTIEHLIDVVDSIWKFRETFDLTLESLSATSEALKTASDHQVHLWKSRQ